jgi:hypothetical protein
MLINHLMNMPPPVPTNKGQALITSVVLFLVASSAVVMGAISPTLDETQMASNLNLSNNSYYASESGLEDVTYRLRQGISVSSVETLAINNTIASTTITATTTGQQVLAVGSQNDLYRKTSAVLTQGIGSAFHYGVEIGAGGVVLNNDSYISGGLFTNGPVNGTSGGPNSMIYGDIIAAGSTGLVSGVHATGTVYAHTIGNSIIDGDAHYQSITSTTVHGVSYPGSTDIATSSAPLSDSDIASWEAAAQAGGIITSPCPYSVSSSTSLGPVKINCDLDINGSSVVTINGPVWVVGNISMSNSAKVDVANSLGSKSEPIIADNQSNRASGGTITLSNNVSFSGAATSSYVMLISQNTSSENGGGTTAISASNDISGDLILFAPHGSINLSNNIKLAEVSAYKLILNNSAEVIYSLGLANLLFSAGPGGGYTFSSWQETQ